MFVSFFFWIFVVISGFISEKVINAGKYVWEYNLDVNFMLL